MTSSYLVVTRKQSIPECNQGWVLRLIGAANGLLSSKLVAWRQGRHATRICREILDIYRNVVADCPALPEDEIYRLVIVARTGCLLTAASEILEGAEESFATWPLQRDLKFRDVVHYLTVHELLEKFAGERWMEADIEQIVASYIPNDI